MAYLKLFGGASVDTAQGPLAGPAVQRRRIGLLARLALAGSQGLSRDKMVAYLWPESDTEKARHLLSDSIYRINQSLGGNVLVASGDQLRIDPELLPCDVLEFQAALEQGDRESAVRLYRGPFLDGFFLEGTLELERWVEGERERLAFAYAGALEALAEVAESGGDRLEAARIWRALAAHDPLSSRITLRLIGALMATGDQASALQRARTHEALLRAEWGAGPADQFALSVAELCAESGRGAVPAPPAVAPQPVPRSRPAAPAPPAVPAPPAEPRAEPAPPPRAVRRQWAAPLLLLTLALTAVAFWHARAAPAPAESLAVAVAVLPFADLSPDHNQEYLADGVTEELISALAQMQGLRVSSRTSSFSLRGQALDARAVGERLGVARVIDGSVRREGDRLRIAVRLADAQTGYQLWSGAYDRQVTGILAVQEELARAIAEALEVRLTSPAAVAAAAVDPEAYQLYLRGRYHWHRRTEADLRASVAAFEESVRRAPDYARAWAGLADAYAILGFYDWAPPRSVFPRAREAALRARESDELRGDAEATLGYVAFYHEWDWAGAEAHFRTAVRLAPRSSKVHQWYANYLTGMGRFVEAEQEMRTATELEPLSLIANAALCWVEYNGGRYEEAVRQCGGTLALDSSFVLAHLWRGWAWGGLGRWDSASTELQRAVALGGRGTLARASLAYAVGHGGDRRRAQAILDSLETRAAAGYQPAYELAKAALGAGRRDEAIGWLERAFADRAHSMVFLEVDPQLAPLRDDPRFLALVRLVGLP